MELEKEYFHNEMKISKNENMPKQYLLIKDKTDEYLNHSINNDAIKGNFNINEIRNYMNNNKIDICDDHLITDVNKNNISQKEKENESLYSSNNDLVMNQNYNYNYNPLYSSNNTSEKPNNTSDKRNGTSEINCIYTSQKRKQNTSNNYDNINYQYYSEQKVFNPGLLFDFSTKKSTRSSLSGHDNDCPEKIIEKNDINNNEIIINQNMINSNSYCNNNGRSSLVNMINEYCDNNNENYLEDNIKDNKMTMNSFDSSQKNYENNKDNENNNYDNNDYNVNNVNSIEEKTIYSEKMNLDNEEICKILNNEKKNNNENENEELQISSKYYISSKNKKEEYKTNKASYRQNKKDTPKVKTKNNNIIINKDQNNYPKVFKQKNKEINKVEIKDKNIKGDNEINVYEHKNKNRLLENIPFQGSYIDYKKYEKYILDNNHDEILNTGNDEDIFGQYVDSIIQRSYRVYKNRQCPSCANLLTNGKSCKECPKYHHLIKSGNNKRNKINK